MICFKRNTILLFLMSFLLILFVYFMGRFLPKQNTSTFSKAAAPAKKKSDTQNEPKRYIGGNDTTIAEWPFVVMLTVYSKSLHPDGGYDLLNSRKCTGSIINAHWIVTAAHCVGDDVSNDLGIVIGIDNIDTQTVGTTTHSQYLRPINIKKHEEFKVVDIKGKAMAHADIALIQVAEEIQQNGVALAKKIDYKATKVFGIGWGAYHDSSGKETLPSIMQELEVTQTPKGLAYTLVDILYGTKFADKVLVSYHLPGEAVSWGDSGGPLVQWNDADGIWELVGVVSSGALFTDVSKYHKWILDSINP